jgi:hypothetical protein
VHPYIGPKGARFVPIFGKSADFCEKIFLGEWNGWGQSGDSAIA